MLQFLLVAAAFAALIQAFVTSDFSLLLAFEHSHSLQPLIFKITGVWGNHEGSMVLWVLILVGYGRRGRRLRPAPARATCWRWCWRCRACWPRRLPASRSSPPTRSRASSPAPLEGSDLNPVLQDIGLAIHPPLLYTGYVGFSVCFSLCHRGADLGPHRRGLGALGAAVDAAELDAS